MMIRKRWLSGVTYAGMFVFGIVMALLGAILPLLSERIRFDLGQVGNLFLTMNSAMLASTLGLGPLMDRFGKKPVLVAGSLFVGLALLIIASASSYRTLLAGVLLLGVGGGALNGATNTLIADLHDDPQRKSAALNLLGAFFGFGALFLPFTIGSLLKVLMPISILHLAMGLSLAPGVLFLALRFPPPKRKQGLLLADVRRVAQHPLVLWLGLLLFFQSGSEFIMGGYTSLYLTRQLGRSISTASYLLAAYWGSMMLGRIVCSRLLLRIKGHRLVLLSALGSALGVAILVLASTERIAFLAAVLIGLGFASIFPTTLGLAGSHFEEYSGTVFGVLFAIALTGGMMLPWVAGQMANAYGLRAALILVAANALMIFFLQLLIPRIRTETS